MGPGVGGDCLRALLLATLVVAASAQHTWLPLHSTGADSSQPNSRQLQAVSTKLRLRDRRGGHQANPSSCRDGSDRETRLPILVIGLKHRWQDRLANFLLKLRWYEDLYVVEAVDGRTIDPVGTMTSGEVHMALGLKHVGICCSPDTQGSILLHLCRLCMSTGI